MFNATQRWNAHINSGLKIQIICRKIAFGEANRKYQDVFYRSDVGPTVLQSQDQTSRFEFFNWLPDICSLWDQLFYSHRVKPVDLGFLFGSTISASKHPDVGPTVLQSQDQTSRFGFFNWSPWNIPNFRILKCIWDPRHKHVPFATDFSFLTDRQRVWIRTKYLIIRSLWVRVRTLTLGARITGLKCKFNNTGFDQNMIIC